MFIKKSVISKLCVILVICLWITSVSANDLSSSVSSTSSSVKETQQINKSENGSDTSKLKLENIPQELYKNSNINTEKGTHKKAVAIDTVDADSLTSYTSVNEDGSKTLYAYDTPIKYIDKDTNEIKFIDNTMEKSNFLNDIFSSVEYTNKSNDIDIALPDKISSGISVENESNKIKMTPVIKENTAPEKTDFTFLGETQTVIEYKNAFGEGINLQYSAINTGLKENIFIEKYDGNNEFQFEIEAIGLIPDCSEGLSITFLDEVTNEPVYAISQPWARDSYTQEGEGDEIHLEQNNYYRVEKTGEGKYLLTMVIKKEFLESFKTVYPVLIDPTVISGRSNILDTAVFSGGANWYSSNYLSVGYHSSNGESLSYIKFTNTAAFKYINANNIGRTDVLYYTKQTYGGSSSYAVKCYDADTTISVQNATYSILNGAVGTYLDSTICGANGVYAFWVGDVFRSWLQYELGAGGFTQNCGFILKADQTGRANKQFASSENASVDYQHFEINYFEDTNITNGIYLIKGLHDSKYLDHVVGDNRVNQWEATDLSNQMWRVTKNTDGTYRLSPMDNQNLALEVYYNIDQQARPVTVYTYAAPACNWRIIRNGDGTYRLMPSVSCTRALDIYYGSETTGTFNGRVFPKRPGIDAQIYDYRGTSNQKWTFEKLTYDDYTYSDTNFPFASSSGTLSAYDFGSQIRSWFTFSLTQSAVNNINARNNSGTNEYFTIDVQNKKAPSSTKEKLSATYVSIDNITNFKPDIEDGSGYLFFGDGYDGYNEESEIVVFDDMQANKVYTVYTYWNDLRTGASYDYGQLIPYYTISKSDFLGLEYNAISGSYTPVLVELDYSYINTIF